MKLLLINPKFPESFWSFQWAIDNVLPRDIKTTRSPLGIATLAALCPEEWDIEIIDENIESIPTDPDADIIGICGMGVQFKRHFIQEFGEANSLTANYLESLEKFSTV
ncbi:hypothetical protein MYX76_04245 [Desulfobacterota bacterium AH_259_B03_O07]|nr:hypothetical protein [Desulfobacterota bacterium AH_259_B03_O07]